MSQFSQLSNKKMEAKARQGKAKAKGKEEEKKNPTMVSCYPK